jgi:hypothetical protein
VIGCGNRHSDDPWKTYELYSTLIYKEKSGASEAVAFKSIHGFCGLFELG